MPLQLQAATWLSAMVAQDAAGASWEKPGQEMDAGERGTVPNEEPVEDPGPGTFS